MERLRTVGATHTDYRVANGSEKSLKIREFEIWSGKSGGKALNFDKNQGKSGNSTLNYLSHTFIKIQACSVCRALPFLPFPMGHG